MALLKTAGTPVAVTDPIACAVCGKSIALASAHAVSVNYNMPGADTHGNALPAYQCSELQHFACTHEHAVIAALACLFEHVEQGNHSAKGKNYGGAFFTSLKSALEGYSVVSGAGGV